MTYSIWFVPQGLMTRHQSNVYVEKSHLMITEDRLIPSALISHCWIESGSLNQNRFKGKSYRINEKMRDDVILAHRKFVGLSIDGARIEAKKLAESMKVYFVEILQS